MTAALNYARIRAPAKSNPIEMTLQDNLFSIFDKFALYPESLSGYVEIFDLLPFSIYWKNQEGKYLGRNHYAAEQMVLNNLEPSLNVNHVIMKSDYDFFDGDTADLFREHDLEALKNPSKTCSFVETIVMPSDAPLELISVKRCILDKNSEPLCVLGCSLSVGQFIQPEKALDELIKQTLTTKLHRLIIRFMASKDANLYNDIAENLIFLIPFYSNHLELLKLRLLTKRELQCLCLSLKGDSAKFIGARLNVSFRTIEIYLGNIREKLKLNFKSDIIEWLWNVIARL